MGSIPRILMQAPYPMQDTGANQVSKSGTNVHECRKSIIFATVKRLRSAYQPIYRTVAGHVDVANAPVELTSVTSLLFLRLYLARLTP